MENGSDITHYARVGSGPWKGLCACGVARSRLRRRSAPAAGEAVPARQRLLQSPHCHMLLYCRRKGMPTCLKSTAANLSCAADTAIAAAAITAARLLVECGRQPQWLCTASGYLGRIINH